MIHEDGHEGFFDRGHGRAVADGVFAQAIERGAANFHDAIQFVGLVDAVGPLIDARADSEILVSHVAKILGPGFVQDVRERGGLVAARQDAVAIADGHLIPLADARRIGMGYVDGPVVKQLFLGMGIVHDRDPALSAVVVIVAQAEGMADFMGGELADASQGRAVEDVGLLVAGGVGREQSFEDQVILAVAQGAQGDGALDDLAGAGIVDRAAEAPAARGAVDPVDHVVADIHGIGALGQHGDFEGIAEAGGFKGLIPPAGAFEQRVADVLGRARIDPVFDGLHRVADGCGGILLLQAMAVDVAPNHGLTDGGAVIDEAGAAVAGAGIVETGLVVPVGQFDEGVVFAQRNGFGSRRNAGNGTGEEAAAKSARGAWGGAGSGNLNWRRPLRGRGSSAAAAAGWFIGKGYGDFNFGVLGERFGAFEEDGAARAIELVVTTGGERGGGACPVANEKIGGVDQNVAAGLGSDGETPEDGLGEGVLNGPPFGGVGTGGAEVFAALHQQHLRTDTLKGNDFATVFEPALEADIVGAEAGGDAGGEQEVVVEAVDLKPEAAGAVIPI